MKRLFINNKRIDTIDELQYAFIKTSNKESLFEELWQRLLSGTLVNWLKQKNTSSISDNAISLLSKNYSDESIGSYIDALCSLCNIERSYQMEKVARSRKPISKKAKNKIELIKTTSWYVDSMFDDNIEWDMVVTSQTDLDNAIEIIKKRYFKLTSKNSFCNKQFNIFLCDLGEPYDMDINMSNISFIGYGSPEIIMKCYPSQKIKIDQLKLTFDSVIIDSTNKCSFIVPSDLNNIILNNCSFKNNAELVIGRL